tara:strand:+ start:362 stop:517 length:156 start_codon:yes stop_codon:yes gene_type:complete
MTFWQKITIGSNFEAKITNCKKWQIEHQNPRLKQKKLLLLKKVVKLTFPSS